MLNGLDLFSGIGGMSLALREWIKPVAYCEIDPYCQGILLSRMHKGELPRSLLGIWENVSTLDGELFFKCIDIIYGGFPCQNISIAGNGKGLEGEQSGLFFEIMRLAKEIKPKFIFLENVPAITSRGGMRVVGEITSLGYDCRWCVISAKSVGALHKRERWFLLAHANGERCDKEQGRESIGLPTTHSKSADCNFEDELWPFKSREHWQEVVSGICRTSNGIPFHVERLRGLGNSVVQIQAKEAFKILMGLK